MTLIRNEDIIQSVAEEIDAVVHLAAINNNVKATESPFQEVNIGLLKKVLEFCKKNNVENIINLSSYHVYNDENILYSQSKRDALDLTRSYNFPKIKNIILPFIYSIPFNGKFSFLNKIPSLIRLPIFSLISALKPVINVDDILSEILANLNQKSIFQDILLAESKDNNISYLLFRKMIDLGFSISVFIVFLIPMILIWFSIVLTSKGPGFLSQTRVGLKEQHFQLYKFRTMKLGTKNMGTHLATASDITKIGSF